MRDCIVCEGTGFSDNNGRIPCPSCYPSEPDECPAGGPHVLHYVTPDECDVGFGPYSSPHPYSPGMAYCEECGADLTIPEPVW